MSRNQQRDGDNRTPLDRFVLHSCFINEIRGLVDEGVCTLRLNPIAAFNFIGSAAFSSSAGQLRSQNIGGAVWLVEGDTNGDAVADFAVHVTVADADPITNADFLL